jgi:hypothetical protein
MYRRGANVTIPLLHELDPNSDDEAIESLLSRLLGIPENRTEVALDNSRASYDANIKHTHYYLFQKQTLVANKDQLFYRQNEAFQPQAIKDTLPILLGVSTNERYELEAKLRVAQRELKLSAKLLEQARNTIDIAQQKAIGLYSEAQAVGILSSPADHTNPADIIESLGSQPRFLIAIVVASVALRGRSSIFARSVESHKDESMLLDSSPKRQGGLKAKRENKGTASPP